MSECQRPVRVLHISDTHTRHWEIEEHFPFPEAEILIHTGDFSDHGTPEEFASFVRWLHEVAPRFVAVVIISGNHDWWDAFRRIKEGTLAAGEAVLPGFMEGLLREAGGDLPANCYVLDHGEASVCGIRIFGSSWCPWHPAGQTNGIDEKRAERSATFDEWQRLSGSDAKHRFGEIPEGIDVLLTHGPPDGILDCLGTPGRGWGSSSSLNRHIYRAQPRMHLFGHLHEQRGEWRRRAAAPGFEGGVEYRAYRKAPPYPTTGPPPDDYPCALISCNAMLNHTGIEQRPPHIAGPARLIVIPARASDAAGVDAPMEQADALDLEGPPRPLEDSHINIVSLASGLPLSAADDGGVHVGDDGHNTWEIIGCPHEEGTVYIVQADSGAFLDTHGRGVQVWNNGGKSVDTLIRQNTSRHAGNLRWRLMECPHEPDAWYIVSARYERFLDAHGSSVQVWKLDDVSIEEAIAKNTSRAARNIRWRLLPLS